MNTTRVPCNDSSKLLTLENKTLSVRLTARRYESARHDRITLSSIFKETKIPKKIGLRLLHYTYYTLYQYEKVKHDRITLSSRACFQ